MYPFVAGAPGTGKDVPGFISLDASVNQDDTEHRGDNQVISKVITFNSMDLTLTVGLWNLDAIASLTGGTVSTTGTTPAQIRKIVHLSTDVPADCAIKGDAPSRSADGGRTRVTYPRCQPGGIPGYGLTDGEYNDLEIAMSAIPNATNQIVVVEQVETNSMVLATTF